MPKHLTFEDFLREKHGENYTGTDDMMPDAYEFWLERLDIEEMIQLGEQYGKKLLELYDH